ncbi:MAG TPA: redoxin domain-containing protein [Tepidisphaeraceae bacterium]|jgi:peroxiredoxin
MPDALKVGDFAPDFELMNQDKQVVKLSSFRGKKKVALLFYPMDFSPTCTQEHCTFGPEQAKLSPDGETIIFGVNADSPFAHAAYKRQYNIPYDLLSDPTRRMIKTYGMFAGEEPYNCAKRGTVVIDKNGKISFYQEVPMKEPRKVADLAAAIAG